ncbi:uncharacterized protein LOC121261999 [Juglans microcarpa x Juglans regia]|uniref:uncharacterized protein LOC121261999 n=1 Tax=Juglans microcarpa x Juglans regia TaxID=2249226 RepID=UPI001B7F2BD9|nr:uncharacterized protein LOC121261999 [Juglans microcarpa x Juglans regia]
MALIVKSKLCFVNGVLPKPFESDPMYHAWIWCNIVVLPWLLNALSKEIASSVLYIDSAEEMWNDLKERFAQSNRPRIFQIRKAIACFKPMHLQILLLDSFPPINKVFSLILQEEKQQEISSDSLSSNEVVAMLTNHNSSQMKGSVVGSRIGKPSAPRKVRPYCTHCGLSGHTIDKCYKIHGYPRGYRAKS